MQAFNVQVTIFTIKHNPRYFIQHCYMFRQFLPAIIRLCVHRIKHKCTYKCSHVHVSFIRCTQNLMMARRKGRNM